MANHQFQTEISQLLHLMIHSLYSNKEIFIRELVSNASDAMDKLQLLTLTDDEYKNLAFIPRITIAFDKEAKTLTISDSGIGMNEADLVEHLGTIAKSGTKSFVEKLTGDAKKDSNLIGQFGVGFYSAFMVAHKVEVVTKKAKETQGYKWVSEGSNGYEISEAQKDSHGTDITLHLTEEGVEFASKWKVESIIKKYSNHIPFPIFVKDEDKEEQVNAASALWRRSKSEITDTEYKEFYSTLSHDSAEPLVYTHTKAEGSIEYTTLFYVPSKAPFDMTRVDYQPGVKLYVKRVFINDDDKELLPVYLRFVRGIIDIEDLPLNVSREILQQNKILANVKEGSTKKILAELKKMAMNDSEKYATFWQEYGRVMKEGVYSDMGHRDDLLELVRFKSSTREGLVSFLEYVSAMKEEQKEIYYITGANEGLIKSSPLLEKFSNDGIEVVLFDDEIDELVFGAVMKYKEYELKNINKTDTSAVADEEKVKEYETLMNTIKTALEGEVKEVKVSARLKDSPACVVFDAEDPGLQMQQIMRQMGGGIGMNMPEVIPVLEINPDHAITAKLKGQNDEAVINDIAHILLDQAKLLGGMTIKDVGAFSARLARVVEKAL